MSEHPARTVVTDPDNMPLYPHLDGNGCCDCDCSACTQQRAPYGLCICPDCNVAACGLHLAVSS